VSGEPHARSTACFALPRLSDSYLRLIAKRPPTSRIRQASIWRGVRDGVEAWNRRDLDAFLISSHDDCEHYPPPEFVEAGLWESHYRGRAGYAKLMSELSAAGTDVHIEPVELIDLGTRMVLLSEFSTRSSGLAGMPLTQTYAHVFTLDNGKVLRQDEYADHAEALEAAGLTE
jgi:ketosteroid isomerase-like protein